MTETYVGTKQLEIADELNDISFQVLVQYPTNEKSSLKNFGPYEMNVCMNANIINKKYPLVIVSHGDGGSHLLYRSISTYLVKNGYIVAMIEHFGNNRNNNDLSQSIENLQYRPRHVCLTIDFLLSNLFFKNNIQKDKISIIGHSFGGYTALALAGGIPWTNDGQLVLTQTDDRIHSLVLMAPAAAYFIPEDSLKNVNLPILLIIGEKDTITPRFLTEILITNGVKDRSKIKVKMIENAGHFSFISPFPSEMKSPSFLPSTDPDGFDRDQFHKELPNMILDFLVNN